MNGMDRKDIYKEDNKNGKKESSITKRNERIP